MNEVYLRPTFLDLQTCREIRSAMNAGVPDTAEVLGDQIAARVETRRASSIDVDERTIRAIEARFDRERDAIAAFFAVPLVGREGAGFLRYRDGDFYRAHRDRADVESWPAAACRRIAIVAFLNGGGDFDGGVLRLYGAGGPIDVPPAPGLLAAFPADVLHEVTAVGRGPRDVIVDWFYDR